MAGIFQKIQQSLRSYRAPGYYRKLDHQWTMVVDLDKCNGCQACVVACYAENNLQTVGKDNCGIGRNMTWIRIEKYYEGNYPDVKVKFIPVMCQQCSSAPCELGCPVFATYHNPDGLNTQIYNRCVGTFTCATYCPYDVRRFNWFSYKRDKPLDQQYNPDVTVRTMGVMEKGTFCIQRIRAAKDKAKDEKRPLRDGDVTPACVQACTTGALTFGDILDPNSRVAKLAKDPRRFHLIEEKNCSPNVIYLKRVMEDGSST